MRGGVVLGRAGPAERRERGALHPREEGDGRDDAADRGGHRGRGPLVATRPPPALGPEENDEEVVEVQIPAGEEDARSESFNEGKYLVYVNKKLSTLAT